MEVKAIEFHRILNVSDQNVNMTLGPNAVLTFNHPLQEKKIWIQRNVDGNVLKFGTF